MRWKRRREWVARHYLATGSLVARYREQKPRTTVAGVPDSNDVTSDAPTEGLQVQKGGAIPRACNEVQCPLARRSSGSWSRIGDRSTKSQPSSWGFDSDPRSSGEEPFVPAAFFTLQNPTHRLRVSLRNEHVPPYIRGRERLESSKERREKVRETGAGPCSYLATARTGGHQDREGGGGIPLNLELRRAERQMMLDGESLTEYCVLTLDLYRVVLFTVYVSTEEIDRRRRIVYFGVNKDQGSVQRIK
ncbi:hypothetical protein KM043_000674 [Ampulex compressa]|nr:hypothetical protein KM043_000674 [Ampulex compressa]